MPICGPKQSICWMVIAVWGVVQLIFMGIFLMVKSPAFAEDLPFTDQLIIDNQKNGTLSSYLDDVYSQASTNCFIAGAMYVGVFAFAFIQHRLNLRANYVMS